MGTSGLGWAEREINGEPFALRVTAPLMCALDVARRAFAGVMVDADAGAGAGAVPMPMPMPVRG